MWRRLAFRDYLRAHPEEAEDLPAAQKDDSPPNIRQIARLMPTLKCLRGKCDAEGKQVGISVVGHLAGMPRRGASASGERTMAGRRKQCGCEHTLQIVPCRRLHKNGSRARDRVPPSRSFDQQAERSSRQIAPNCLFLRVATASASTFSAGYGRRPRSMQPSVMLCP